MFDTGFWEFTLIAVIALVVVGPERIPALAKSVGKYVGKIKNFIASVKSDVSDEFDIDSIKKQLTLDDNNILDIVKDTKKDIERSIDNSADKSLQLKKTNKDE